MTPEPPVTGNGYGPAQRAVRVPARWLTALALLPVAGIGVLLVSLGPLWRAYQVEDLLNRLDYATAETCHAEVVGLAAFGEDAIDPVASWIKNRDHTRRWKAVLVLSQIPSDRVSPLLLEALETEDQRAREATESGLLPLQPHEANPEIDNLFKETGLLSAERRDWKAAVEVFDQIIREEPGFAEAYFQRAKALYHLGDYDRCLRDCDVTLRLDPARFPARMLMGICYHQQARQEIAEADRVLGSVDKILPSTQQARQEMAQADREMAEGELRAALGHRQLAQRFFEQAYEALTGAYSDSHRLSSGAVSSRRDLWRIEPGARNPSRVRYVSPAR